MIQAAVFTTALALAFAALLALVLLSGRLSSVRRRQLELAMAWVLAPVLVAFWAWLMFEAVQLKSVLLIVGQVVIGILLAVQGVRLVRRHRAASRTKI